MKSVALAAALVAACSTTKNPSKCVDGVCIDPARPYCDFDGLIGGKPDTCIAADCTSNELEACRGNVAVKCDAAGTDYVEVECPLGCDPSSNGCRECTNNAQCAAAEKPICDPDTSLCRGCAADDECDSRVCDFTTARCVAESDVVYTAPNVFGTCSKNQPCDLAAAVMAVLSTSGKTLRMLPGTYTAPLDVHFSTPNPVKIVATGATISMIGDSPAIVVTDGANIEIRGLTSISERHLRCGAANATLSAVTFDQSTFTSVGGAPIVQIERCTTKLTHTTVTGQGSSIGIFSDGALELDHVFMNTQGNISTLNAARARIQITNSLLIDTTPQQFFSQDTQLPGSSYLFAFSTFIQRGAKWAMCEQTNPFRTIAFENSIVASTGVVDDALPFNSDCSFTSTLVFPHQGALQPGMIIADPLFVDPAAKDFHLKETSIAINRATPATVLSKTDLEGRPRGPAPDLGAYERP